MTKKEVALAAIPSFFTVGSLIKWMPGIFLAISLYAISSRWKCAIAYSITLGISILLFYLIMANLGWNVSMLMTDGWLLGPFEQDYLWQLPAYSQILTIDWSFLYQHLGIIATIPLVCFISGILMLSAIELTTGKTTDANHELRTTGISNILTGILGGGFIGYPSTTFTVMQFELGATTRLAGILNAIVTGLVLYAGTYLLGFIPRFVIGGLLVYFGYQFICEWGFKTIQRELYPISKQFKMTN